MQRHAPARLGHPQPGQRLPAVRLEPAERVGEGQPVAGVDLAGDRGVDELAVGRGRGVLAEVAEVAAARDDVAVVDRFEQHRDAGRLVLAVAVHRDQYVVAAVQGEGECRHQGGPVPAVVWVVDPQEPRLSVEQPGGAVGGPVVDDEDFRAVPPNLRQHLADGLRLVVDRDGGEPAHEMAFVVPRCRGPPILG